MHTLQPRQLKDKLAWFIENVELQLADLKLQEQNIELQFYWDTEHVMRAVLGMADFYGGGEFRKPDFDDAKTLVVCLAAENWFGPICLLPPHRAEFYNSFKSGFGVGDAKLPPTGAKRFFQDCGLANMPSLEEFRNEPPDEQVKIVNQYAGKADQLFKGVNCALGDWKARLTSMYRRGLLNLDSTDEVDYSELFEDPVFRRARDFFDTKRPVQQSGVNNLTDATALCLLLRQVAAFEKGQDRRLPRFFETSPLFRQALTYLADQSKEISSDVLRDADYYFFRAMFKPPRDLVNDGQHDKFLSSLISAKDKVKDMLNPSDAGTPITAELVDEIKVEGIPLRTVIDDLKRYSFLERVWLPYAHKTVSQVADEYVRSFVEAANEVTNDGEFDIAVRKTLDKLDRSLAGHVRQYRLMTEFFLEFERHIERFQYDVGVTAADAFDVFKISGLLRFGVPQEYHPRVKEIAGTFISGEQEDIKVTVPKLCRMCREVERKTADVASRHVLMCLLWVLKMHDVIKRLHGENGEEASWLLALTAASAIERRDFRTAIREVAEIEKRYNKLEDPFARGGEAIRLAYLYFHLWRDGGGVVKWRDDRPLARSYPVETVNLWIQLAINFAKDAYSARHLSVAAETYASNLYLYYVTEGGEDEVFRGMTRIAGQVVRYKIDPAVWQYRFDDTLARYFHRQSTKAATLEEKRERLEQARKHIRDAVHESHGDRDVKSYESIIVNAEIELQQELKARSPV